jgi:hypothetical protein
LFADQARTGHLEQRLSGGTGLTGANSRARISQAGAECAEGQRVCVPGNKLLAAGRLQEFINRGQKSKLCLLVHIALVA